MIIPEDRQMAIDLIDEAVTTGARQHKACEVIESSLALSAAGSSN